MVTGGLIQVGCPKHKVIEVVRDAKMHNVVKVKCLFGSSKVASRTPTREFQLLL